MQKHTSFGPRTCKDNFFGPAKRIKLCTLVLQSGGSDIPDVSQLFYSPADVDLMGKIHSPEVPNVNISQLTIPTKVKCGPGSN